VKTIPGDCNNIKSFSKRKNHVQEGKNRIIKRSKRAKFEKKQGAKPGKSVNIRPGAVIVRNQAPQAAKVRGLLGEKQKFRELPCLPWLKKED